MPIDGGLRAIFHDHIKGPHWQSIETAVTGGGVPDDNGCYQGVEFWIEYKKASHWRVPSLTSQQTAWHSRRARAGGRTFFAVRRQVKMVDELWLIKGTGGKELRRAGLKELQEEFILGKWDGGPSAWPWCLVLALFTGYTHEREYSSTTE